MQYGHLIALDPLLAEEPVHLVVYDASLHIVYVHLID